MPRLTIGLPIYDGAASARACIDSLLAQRFDDFVLLIHDNASTDGTSDICAAYARADPRVRHLRHPATLPQSANFRSVLMAARTEFFMWAADDDLWGPGFAAACIAELDRAPAAVAACTKVMFTCPGGGTRLSRSTHALLGTPAERVRAYLANPRDSARLYGVYRTGALQAAYPEGIAMFGYDWLVVALSLLAGEHREAAGVELVRTGHPPGKYFARFSRHFDREPGLRGRLATVLPLLPLTLALRRHLPAGVWRAVRGKVLRLNLHQALMRLAWRHPALDGLLRVARRLDRAVGNG